MQSTRCSTSRYDALRFGLNHVRPIRSRVPVKTTDASGPKDANAAWRGGELSKDQIDHAEDDEQPDDENDADDPQQRFQHLFSPDGLRERGVTRFCSGANAGCVSR
jgi:hypothetical protein